MPDAKDCSYTGHSPASSGLYSLFSGTETPDSGRKTTLPTVSEEAKANKKRQVITLCCFLILMGGSFAAILFWLGRRRRVDVPKFKFVAVPREDLTKLFSINRASSALSNWTGSNGCASTRMDENSMFWIFGDSLVGSNDGAGHRTVVSMTHNSAAVLDMDTKKPAFSFGLSSGTPGHPPPVPEASLWTPINGEAQSYLTPTDVVKGRTGVYIIVAKETSLTTDNVKPNTKVIIPYPTPTARDYDLLELPVLTDVQGSICTWEKAVAPADQLGHPPALSKRRSRGKTDKEYLYFLGSCVDGTDGLPYIRLSRIGEVDLVGNKLTAMQAFVGLEKGYTDLSTAKWTGISELQANASLPRPQKLFQSSMQKANLRFSDVINSWYLFALEEPGQVYLVMAPSLLGPWTKQPVYRIPREFQNDDVRSTSAISVPEFADESKRELVFAYSTELVNASDAFEEYSQKPALFSPRFVSLFLEEVSLIFGS